MAITPDNSPAPGPEGQPPFAASFYQEILDHMIEGFGVGELILNQETSEVEDFRITSLNRSAHAHYGFDLTQYIGVTIGGTPLASEGRPVLQLLKRMYAGDPNNCVEGYHENYDIYMRMRVIKMEGTNFVMLFQNITAEKELEARRLMENTLNETRRLLDLVIHDLKTPFTTLGFAIASSEMGLNKLLGTNPALSDDPSWRVVRNGVERADLISRRMNRMMREMTVFSRLDKETEIELTEADCAEYLKRLFNSEIQPLTALKQQDIQLEIMDEEPMLAMLNADYATRLIINLISNSIRYTPEGGKITVRLNADADNVILGISDTGIGISAENLPKIFEPFFRVEGGLDIENGNAGLGLAAVKKVCELHKAKVDVESEPGSGTLFLIKIPRVIKAVA
jgi:signal transduction histidine kinase